MEEEQLEKIQEILANRNPRSEIEEKSGRQSIGIVNVHERMLLYFGDATISKSSPNLTMEWPIR